MNETRSLPARDEDCAALLRGELADGLQEVTGLHRNFAEDWAEKLTAYLRTRLGAKSIYIPAPDRAARDAAIFAEFNGKNAAEVCHRHGVSRTTLYRVVDQQRALLQSRSPISCLKTGQDPV